MKFKLFTVIFATALLLLGCQGNTQEGRGDNDTTYENTGNRDGFTKRSNDNNNTDLTQNLSDRDRNSNNRASNNTQDEYDVSKEAADRIVDEVADIDQAYVLTTRNNAYVAAVLDEENTTPNDNLTQNDRSHNSTGTNVRNTNDRNVKNRTVNEGDANKRGPDNHTSNRRDVEGHEVTDDVKNEIASIVQEIDDDIDNVYVSTSPDFVDLVSNYADDMDNGEPVRGFFDQIGNTIERIFPQNKR